MTDPARLLLLDRRPCRLGRDTALPGRTGLLWEDAGGSARLGSGVADGAGARRGPVSGLIVRTATAFRSTRQGLDAARGFGSGPLVFVLVVADHRGSYADRMPRRYDAALGRRSGLRRKEGS